MNPTTDHSLERNEPVTAPPSGLLHRASVAFAIAGGLLIFATSLLILYSVLSRWLVGKAVYGDIELVQLASAVGASLFLPLAQLSGSHITVDLFTIKAGPRAVRAMQRIGSLLTALVLFVLVWRTAVGAIELYRTGAEMMMLRMSIWTGYAALIPGLLLGGLVALLDPGVEQKIEAGLH